MDINNLVFNTADDSQTKPGRTLSKAQETAIDLLLDGKTIGETSLLVGVSRRTVSQWHAEDALFLMEMNARRRELWSSCKERLLSLVHDAIDILEDDLKQFDDSKARSEAAIQVLRWAGIYQALTRK